MTSPDYDAVDRTLFGPAAHFEIVTEEVLGDLPLAGAADLDDALAASAEGFKAWRAMTPGNPRDFVASPQTVVQSFPAADPAPVSGVDPPTAE